MKTTRKIVSTPNGGGASENYYNNLTSDHDHILYEVAIKRIPSADAGMEFSELIIGAVSKATAQKYFGVTDNSDEAFGKFPVLECLMGEGNGNAITIVDFMRQGRLYPYSQLGFDSPSLGSAPWASGLLLQNGTGPTAKGVQFYGVAYKKNGTLVITSKNYLTFNDLFDAGSKPFYKWTAYLYRTRI